MAANKVTSLLLIALVLLTSCFSRSSAMTRQTYDNIKTGESFSTLHAKLGDPYAVHAKGDGTEEYEYIERVDGDSFVMENHFFIIVQGGEVVGKYMSQEKRPAYDLIYNPDPNSNTETYPTIYPNNP